MITDKKTETIFTHSSKIDVPLISKNKFTIVDVCDNTFTYFKGNDCITIKANNSDKTVYQNALELFNDGADLEANIMHISFNIGESEFERVLDVIKRK